MVSISGTSLLAVANRRSWSISLVDVAQEAVIGEYAFAGEPVDIVATKDGRLWIADCRGHRVVEIEVVEQGLRRLREIKVAADPMRLAVDPAGKTLAVAGLWSQRVTLIDLSGDPSSTRSVPLSFPPRGLRWLDGAPDVGMELLVTDAFGGQIAVVNAAGRTPPPATTLSGHNLGLPTLSLDEREVLLPGEILHADVPTTREGIASGRLLENVLHRLSVVDLRRTDSDLAVESLTPARLSPPAADPVTTCQLDPDRYLTLLGGRNELLIHDAAGGELSRIPCPAGPSQIVRLPDGNRWAILSRFEQSVSLFDGDAGRITRVISLGPLPELTPADRGERLFFSANLSLKGLLSCHSCHPQGHSSDDLADTFADGSYGTPKRVLSLLGTRDNNPWGWNGAFRELHSQVSQSVTSSMQGPSPTPSQVNDLVAYLHTLKPPPGSGESANHLPLEPASIQRGRQVFTEAGCAACHVPPLTYTSDVLYDVGFSDEQGLKKFNPPSLRGLSQRRRFFHDGRAGSLEEALQTGSHAIRDHLPADDFDALLDFLRSL